MLLPGQLETVSYGRGLCQSTQTTGAGAFRTAQAPQILHLHGHGTRVFQGPLSTVLILDSPHCLACILQGLVAFSEWGPVTTFTFEPYIITELESISDSIKHSLFLSFFSSCAPKETVDVTLNANPSCMHSSCSEPFQFSLNCLVRILLLIT